VLDVLTENVKKLSNNNIWHDDVLTEEDKAILEKEANSDPTFDKLQLRKKLNDEFINGQAVTIVKKTNNARIVILTSDTQQTYPWDLWAKIFEWFGQPTSGDVWQVYLYASGSKRILPSQGVPVGPEHLNGGYTYPCKSDCIVIYRYEEATRVLIHELLHAACTDNHTNHITLKEAATEAWAELILVALLSKGSKKKAYELWNIQDHYIQDLNYTVKNFHNVNTFEDYGARYTTMREKVFNDLGIMLDKNYRPKRITISRFTSPQLHN
jgi:hypothetical protein